MTLAEWFQAAAAETVGGLVGAITLYIVIRAIDGRRERRQALQRLARATSLYGDGLTSEALAIATTLLEDQAVQRNVLMLATVQRLVADCRAKGEG